VTYRHRARRELPFSNSFDAIITHNRDWYEANGVRLHDSKVRVGALQ
jgi:NAD(P)H-nitrite reductase large subunit